MKVRYKTGKFNISIAVRPGDLLNLTLSEYDANTGMQIKQRVSEEINISMTVSHWVMFYVTGVGFGGMFGGEDIGSKMGEIFVEPVLISDEDLLKEN